MCVWTSSLKRPKQHVVYVCVIYTLPPRCREKQCPLQDLAACADRELICAQLKLMYSFDVKRFKYFRHWRAGGRRSEQHCKGAVLLIDRMLSSSRPLFWCASALRVISVPLQMERSSVCVCVHDDEIFCSERNTQKERPKGHLVWKKMLQWFLLWCDFVLIRATSWVHVSGASRLAKSELPLQKWW